MLTRERENVITVSCLSRLSQDGHNVIVGSRYGSVLPPPEMPPTASYGAVACEMARTASYGAVACDEEHTLTVERTTPGKRASRLRTAAAAALALGCVVALAARRESSASPAREAAPTLHALRNHHRHERAALSPSSSSSSSSVATATSGVGAGPRGSSAPASVGDAAAHSKTLTHADLLQYESVRKVLEQNGVDYETASNDELFRFVPREITVEIWPSRVHGDIGVSAADGYVAFDIAYMTDAGGISASYVIVMDLFGNITTIESTFVDDYQVGFPYHQNL